MDHSILRRWPMFVIYLTVSVLVVACYPGQPEDLGEIGMVITANNPDGNYSGLHTWAMEDTVIALINEDDSSSEQLDRTYDPVILSKIADNMEARGFSRLVPDNEGNLPSKPDVVIRVGAVQSTKFIGFVYWGYPGWGYPGWGWGYPSTGYYPYTQGTIVYTMADWREADPDNPEDVTPVLWVATLNGALSGQGSNPDDDIPSGIDQSFKQSTYIQAAGQ